MKLSVLRVVYDTIVDGPGLRTSIYFAGCTHHCRGCHNPVSWNINNGNLMTINELLEVVLDSDFNNVTFSGGDPFYQVEGVTQLAKEIKSHSNKTIWCYSGYRFEDILSNSKLSQLLTYIDVLVDGPFIEEQKVDNKPFVGSSNQRLIDVAASLREGRAINFDLEL